MTGNRIELAGQVAIVTAGAHGVGEGCARSLARHGAQVVICDIDVEKGEALVKDLAAAGAGALFVGCDMLDTAQIADMVRSAGETFGRIDIVVNNAGGVNPRLFVESVERSWRKHIDMNFVSMLATTSEALKWMIPAGRGGSIINISSVEGLRGCPTMAVYAGCKAAMIGFTKTLAAEVGHHGVRVNAIAPDQIESPGIRNMLPDTPELRRKQARYLPLMRMGAAEELGDLVAFLCSPLASFITGTTQVIDGGSMAAQAFARNADHTGWEATWFSL